MKTLGENDEVFSQGKNFAIFAAALNEESSAAYDKIGSFKYYARHKEAQHETVRSAG